MRIFVNSTGLGVTALESAAAGLSSGGVASLSSMSSSVSDHPDNQNILQYNVDCWYDSSSKTVRFPSKGTVTSRYVMVTYDEATDTWEQTFESYVPTTNPPSSAANHNGHIFGGDAMDPSSGRLWLTGWDDNTEVYYSDPGDDDFSYITLSPGITDAGGGAVGSGTNNQTSAMAFHPDLYGSGNPGLVYHGRVDLATINLTDNDADHLSDISDAGFAPFATYDPDSGKVFCGGGATTPTRLYKVSGAATPTVASVGNVLPMDCSVNEPNATIYADPASGGRLYCMGTEDNSGYYYSDNEGATWSSKQSFPAGLIEGSGITWACCSMRHLGVFFFIGQITRTTSWCKIWKP